MEQRLPLGRALRPRAVVGYAYLAMLGALALVSVASAALGTMWQTQAKRDKERELLKVGVSYAKAIASYRRMATGSVVLGPPNLEALLLDDRFAYPVRHLRRAYPDPMNPAKPWSIILDSNGRIAGVHSTSTAEPLRRTPLVIDGHALDAARTYIEWRFVAKDAQ
jgi:type II secretory pathway pseudopilin PulG